jgi:hypothetical protein
MTESDPVVYLIFIFVFFPVLWLGVSFVIAQIGGWAVLAQVYHFTGEFRDERWSFQSAKMRWGASYNSVLTAGANPEGLYLVPLFLFRFGHPPLFIPWHDISVKQTGFIFRYTELGFHHVPSVSLKIGRRLTERLATAAGESWPG